MPHQQVPQEPSLVQIPQRDHVIYTLHRGGVHGLEGDLLTDLVLLRTIYHWINMTSSETKSPDRLLVPFLHRQASIAVQRPSPWPLPQLAPQSQSPTTENHPSWRQHQGTCTKTAHWHWVFVRMMKFKCSYLAQMQHFGNMDQVCRGEKPFLLSEIC